MENNRAALLAGNSNLRTLAELERLVVDNDCPSGIVLDKESWLRAIHCVWYPSPVVAPGVFEYLGVEFHCERVRLDSDV